MKIKTSTKSAKYTHLESHMPFSEAAIDSSVTEKLGEITEMPDFQKGYTEWRNSFEAGKAGIFSMPVGKSVEYIETTMIEGNVVK